MPNAIRSSQIVIDTPKKDGHQWVSSILQGLEIDTDGNILSVNFSERKMHRRIDQVATQIYTTTDPVTQAQVTASVAGIGKLIKQAVIAWMLEDFPDATYDPVKDLVVLSGANS